ncbi:hypothetical protein HBI56_055510 [Parastagonospora nodorum]|nr:hypothetical protein HBH53_148510 [Parastagonospora nodorum]KAH3967092.1 hypothetical protein HBH51_139920 [Parastagonospora nodorum]KAH4002992.1 hypothetical protein HBI10_068490 [Parastagonospora nodorum]KAH4026915.1 hypothetical protein HBI09_145740 [Parastagonospora nodorum]KAH4028053.1 hypothetical protein HBI13_049530 [Parastagonospora nodorum]
MKFAITALFAGLAVAENVTISNFLYVGVNGYDQISFSLSVDDINCGADHYVIGGMYACDNKAWTFQINEAQGHQIKLLHAVNGKTLSGDFDIKMNGPITTVRQQIGTSTAELN